MFTVRVYGLHTYMHMCVCTFCYCFSYEYSLAALLQFAEVHRCTYIRMCYVFVCLLLLLLLTLTSFFICKQIDKLRNDLKKSQLEGRHDRLHLESLELEADMLRSQKKELDRLAIARRCVCCLLLCKYVPVCVWLLHCHGVLVCIYVCG